MNAVRLTRPFTGVGRFTECVLAEWARMALPFERVTLYSPRPLDPERVLFPLDRFTLVVGGPDGPDPIWEQRFLARQADEMDVLFSPSYTLPLGYSGKAAVVNHGPAENRPLSLEWMRALAYEQLYRWSARRADHVFTVSRSVKQRLVEDYGIEAGRVTVAFNAASALMQPASEHAKTAARQRYAGGDAPFTLFVGKLARRHAIPELMAGFALALQRTGLPHRLVLAGPNYLGLDLEDLARKAGLAAVRLIHHPFVEHRELPALYSAAEEVVYPATPAEGFGLPVIEAMACGTPVCTVAQGGIPEFADGAVRWLTSCAPQHLADGIIDLMTHEPLRRELSAAGLARAGEITWRRTAERILSVLAGLAAPGSGAERQKNAIAGASAGAGR